VNTPVKPGPDTVSLSIQPVHQAHDDQVGPPRRSKVVAFLAAIACVGCCALPLLVPLGLMSGAGIAAATTGLLAVSAALFGVAGSLWFVHRRRTRRRETGHGCAGGHCSC
jgi:mercuric ion transport protein